MLPSDELPQGCVNSGFRTVVRVWSGEQISASYFNLNLTSSLPLFYLNVTFFGGAKTVPVRFKWGFGEGPLKDKFASFEAS